MVTARPSVLAWPRKGEKEKGGVSCLFCSEEEGEGASSMVYVAILDFPVRGHLGEKTTLEEDYKSKASFSHPEGQYALQCFPLCLYEMSFAPAGISSVWANEGKFIYCCQNTQAPGWAAWFIHLFADGRSLSACASTHFFSLWKATTVLIVFHFWAFFSIRISVEKVKNINWN